ncbi:MAG TPA: sensor histidine kinase [Gemmatimonadaceae bacterium]|nr:sensor histidine kinase [Gemmatimonadaceae bacterium]
MDGEQLGSPSVDLAREAHHRIANHLGALASMVKRRTDHVRDGDDFIPRGEVTNTLSDINSVIVAIGRLHRTLASLPARRELALDDLLNKVLADLEAIFGDRLHSRVHLQPACRLDAGQVSIFILVLSEIVANAMKYAHPTGLPVELDIFGKPTPDGEVSLLIADDGVGLPDDFDEARHEGKGLRLIRGLIESGGGHVEVMSTNIGLGFAIRLPATQR